MKVSAQKRIEGISAGTFTKIVEEITAHVAAVGKCHCPEDHDRCSCTARFIGSISDLMDKEKGATLSCYGERVAIDMPQDGLTVNYQTCGGTIHRVEIDLLSGYVVAESVGLRNSDGWGMASLSPTLAELLQSIVREGWTILELETSQPDWGVNHWLAGKLKEGPANLQEAEEVAA